jgi:hypothetical protein
MLLRIVNHSLRLKGINFLALCCITSLTACSTDMSFISRDDLKASSFATERPIIFTEKQPTEYGAIRFASKDAPEGTPGQVFIFKKKNGAYMAETKLMDTGKQRFFFSLGINYRQKTPAVGFKMEF